jgi:hypothetical protein
MICILNKYYSGDQIKKNQRGGACSTYGDTRGAYRVLVGRPEGKRPLGRPRRGLDYNIKIDLHEVGWGGLDWIDLAQDRDRRRALVNAAKKFQVP